MAINKKTLEMFRFALFIIPEISVYNKINESNHIDIVSFKSENKVNLFIVVLLESTFCLISGTC